jgi:hypothetical protein
MADTCDLFGLRQTAVSVGPVPGLFAGGVVSLRRTAPRSRSRFPLSRAGKPVRNAREEYGKWNILAAEPPLRHRFAERNGANRKERTKPRVASANSITTAHNVASSYKVGTDVIPCPSCAFGVHAPSRESGLGRPGRQQ